MNLYSKKQKWKIVLLAFALIGVAFSLWVSNRTVQGVSSRERMRVTQWASAIKKKAELVAFTNKSFEQLRVYERAKMQVYLDATLELSKPVSDDVFPDYAFPLAIINNNKELPVILLDDRMEISGFVNLEFDTLSMRKNHPSFSRKQLQTVFEDSLRFLCEKWKKTNKPFEIEVVEGLTMSYFYGDSKRTIALKFERDSLFEAFNKELIKDTKLVPVILYDPLNDSLLASNFPKIKLERPNLKKTIAALQQINKAILIDFGGVKARLFYDNSSEIKQLQLYPYIQFTIIGLFILIAYLLFSTFRKAEQNQVWAGMAKETAHQMGTPLSSLMAWVQLLETQDVDPNIRIEMEKDVHRLDKVSQRFSKIGSETKLESHDIVYTVNEVIDYLRPRISQKIEIVRQVPKTKIFTKHNPPLMEWVIENIARNAVDAMDISGILTFELIEAPEWIHIDISDSGKGLPAKEFKRIFAPGYTTKKRGWGLGLSLVKRIVSEYHHGKVFVEKSELGKGTTIRVSLPYYNS